MFGIVSEHVPGDADGNSGLKMAPRTLTVLFGLDASKPLVVDTDCHALDVGCGIVWLGGNGRYSNWNPIDGSPNEPVRIAVILFTSPGDRNALMNPTGGPNSLIPAPINPISIFAP